MKFYESIEDMPVYNWFKCVENKEYKYCLVDLKEYVESKQELFELQFEKLYCEFIDTFGIPKDLDDIIVLQNQIKILEIDLALGKKSAKTFLNIKKLELEDKLKVEKPKTNNHKVAIEKFLGFRINLKEVTVIEYYNYLKALD